MIIIKRDIGPTIINNLKPNKVIILTGPRRVGKTVLINEIIKQINTPYLLLNGEDFETHSILSRRTTQNYNNLLADKKFLIIDEAHKIPDIGNILKLMVDEIKELKVLITGSSTFEMSNLTGEPLTGRKFTFNLYPFSESEFNQTENIIQKADNLKQRLVFGNYPELLSLKSNEQKAEYLKELVKFYLLKDILAFENIRNSSKILSLLRLIAYQVGSEVSNQELGTQLGISKNTVEKYLDLLSKVYVIHKLEGFSRNLRKEITKKSKWFFIDNGIRNILIANINPLDNRNDIGILWENYIISERIKYQQYNRMLVNNYFWRTYSKQEIDWVEEREGNLFAYEIKWKDSIKKVPSEWKVSYPNSIFKIISKDNYIDWLK